MITGLLSVRARQISYAKLFIDCTMTIKKSEKYLVQCQCII